MLDIAANGSNYRDTPPLYIQVLQTLLHLPITTRNQVSNSHLLTVVTRWLQHTTNKPLEAVSDITDPPQQSTGVGPGSLAAADEPHSQQQQQQVSVEESMEGELLLE